MCSLELPSCFSLPALALQVQFPNQALFPTLFAFPNRGVGLRRANCGKHVFSCIKSAFVAVLLSVRSLS
jgi:hypothetical protein